MTVTATWTGPPRAFPRLGLVVQPGDTLNIPAAVADEDRRWEPVKKTPAGKKNEPDAPPAAGDDTEGDQ